MAWLRAVLFLYALLNIGGGIAGFVTAHSRPSLISGVLAGVFVIGATTLAVSNPRVGYIIAAIVALGDLGFFASKLMEGGGIWPAGVMAAASVIVLICLAVAHFGAQPAAQ